MSDETPSNDDVATTANYLGWMKGQAFAIAHLWAFSLTSAGYDAAQARSLFESMLQAYENSGNPETPLGDMQSLIKLYGLSHLEEIFQCAQDALAHAQSAT